MFTSLILLAHHSTHTRKACRVERLANWRGLCQALNVTAEHKHTASSELGLEVSVPPRHFVPCINGCV